MHRFVVLASLVCASGSCLIVVCDTGYADCDGIAANGCEVDTSMDDANCGGCGQACGSGQTCAGGVCQ
jgi:hypothetical protein